VTTWRFSVSLFSGFTISAVLNGTNGARTFNHTVRREVDTSRKQTLTLFAFSPIFLLLLAAHNAGGGECQENRVCGHREHRFRQRLAQVQHNTRHGYASAARMLLFEKPGAFLVADWKPHDLRRLYRRSSISSVTLDASVTKAREGPNLAKSHRRRKQRRNRATNPQPAQ
jgi:hypothetical protein